MKASSASHAKRRLSFRDPSGQIFSLNGRVLRCVFPEGTTDLNKALNCATLAAYQEKAFLVRSVILSSSESARLNKMFFTPKNSVWLEHPRVFFPSYPYEWPAEMLYEAGSLTLQTAEDLVDEDLGLKDASAYNILFEGSRPVFVDWLSFESREGKGGRWLAFAQFTKHFLLPLALFKFKRLSCPDTFLRHRDGVDELEAFDRCSQWERWFTPLLFLITIPTILSRWGNRKPSGFYASPKAGNREKERFTLAFLLGSLRRKLRRLKPGKPRDSRWTGYMEAGSFHYDAAQIRAKEKFVRETLTRVRAKHVLDVGCNTGHFSLIAAGTGARVVAIDSDEATVGKAWRKVRDSGADVQTLVVDLARPTPAIGWENSEFPSFLERASQSFDVIMMLAVIHHLSISERIPLRDLVNLASQMTTDHLLVEFVSPSDPQVLTMVRGRDYSHLSRKHFEEEFGRNFKVVKMVSIPGTERALYHLKKKKNV